MVSIRGKIWFSIINRIIKKLDTLFDIDKLDNQKLGSSFPRWKKAAFVDISEFKIDELEVLKLKNINNKNKKTLLYIFALNNSDKDQKTRLIKFFSQKPKDSKSKIVTIGCDSGDKYQSKINNETWLRNNNFSLI